MIPTRPLARSAEASARFVSFLTRTKKNTSSSLFGSSFRSATTRSCSSSSEEKMTINKCLKENAGEEVSFSSSFLQTLQARGFLHQCTDYKGLDDLLSSHKKLEQRQEEERGGGGGGGGKGKTAVGESEVICAYLGFDATASSLHVGSLVQIMLLRHLQRCGHKPIILIGGGTTKIGDPSGKDASRQMMSEEQIQHNINQLKKIFEVYLVLGDGPTDAVVVNNADWLDNINYIDFLRSYGPYFTINRMLSFESVKQRLDREQPLTFLEFNYMLLQAYDFLELYRSKYQVRIQIGGSDQWGNIINGIELARKCQQAHLFGLTAPLITTSSGKKMGKTAAGAIWLDKQLLSEFDYWQFWRNTPDEDVEKFLYLFTDIPLEEIEVMMAGAEGAGMNVIKKRLADEVTQLLHGIECLADIHKTVGALFSSTSSHSSDQLASLPKITISVPLSTGNLRNNHTRIIRLVDVLLISKLSSSKSDAKRQILAGSIRIDGAKCMDPNEELELPGAPDDDADGNGLHAVISFKLSSGKKKHAVVTLEPQQ